MRDRTEITIGLAVEWAVRLACLLPVLWVVSKVAHWWLTDLRPGWAANRPCPAGTLENLGSAACAAVGGERQWREWRLWETGTDVAALAVAAAWPVWAAAGWLRPRAAPKWRRRAAGLRALADHLARSGAFDLIVGHHAHVVQPVELVHGVPVVFGLGNFLSSMTDPTERDGVIAKVAAVREPRVERWRFDVTLVPTWVDPSSFTIRPTVGSLSRPDLAPLHAELRASWERTVAVMTAPGVAHPDRPLPRG